VIVDGTPAQTGTGKSFIVSPLAGMFHVKREAGTYQIDGQNRFREG
jgi:hypothetical protein